MLEIILKSGKVFTFPPCEIDGNVDRAGKPRTVLWLTPFKAGRPPVSNIAYSAKVDTDNLLVLLEDAK